jgi:hypothetical protein
MKTCIWKLGYALNRTPQTWTIPCIDADSDWFSKNMVNEFLFCPYCGKRLEVKVSPILGDKEKCKVDWGRIKGE